MSDPFLDSLPKNHEPFLLEGGQRGAFLIHGFTGTPLQLRPLGHHLHRLGYTVRAPLLPGHATEPEDLHRQRWRDWVAAAGRAWEDFRARTPESAVVGYSMGGLVALTLAAEAPPRALVCLATPHRIELRDARAAFLPILKYFTRYVEIGQEFEKRDFGDGQPFAEVPYTRLSTHAIHELLRLAGRVRRLLPGVTVPTLLVYGELDDVVPPSNGAAIAAALGGPARVIRYAGSGHELPFGPDREEVWAEVRAFLEEQLSVGEHALGR